MGPSGIPYLNGPCAALLTVNALLALLLAALAWRRRPAPGAGAFCVAMCALAWWSATYACELSSSQLATQVFWGRLSFLGVVSLPVAWLSFACAHTNRRTALSLRAHLALLVVPLVTTAIIWTDDWHHLFYASIAPNHGGLVDAWVSVKGPWFWANMGYSYALLLAGSVMVAAFAIGLPAAHRTQSLAIMVGVAAPWVANVIHLTTDLVPGLDPTPFAFAVTGACLAWGLFRHRLLDVVPIAYRAVLDGLPDPVMVLGADGRLVEANPAAWRMLATEGRGPIGRTSHQIAEARPGLAGVLTAPPAGAEVQVEVSGELRDFEVEAAPLNTAGGVRVGKVLILHDITERKAVLRALAQSEKLYRDAIEAANGVPYQRSFGSEGFDHIGEGIWELVGLAPSQATPAALRAALVQPAYPHGGAVLDPACAFPWTAAGPGAPQSVDYQVRLATGETRWLADSFVLVGGETSPEPLGAMGIISDVSERRQAEEALREARDRFEAVIETAPGVAIQGLDRDGTVMHWNRASTAIYGFEAQEAIGRRIQDLILADADAARFEALLELVWRTTEAPSPTEWSPPHARRAAALGLLQCLPRHAGRGGCRSLLYGRGRHRPSSPRGDAEARRRRPARRRRCPRVQQPAGRHHDARRAHGPGPRPRGLPGAQRPRPAGRPPGCRDLPQPDHLRAPQAAAPSGHQP